MSTRLVFVFVRRGEGRSPSSSPKISKQKLLHCHETKRRAARHNKDKRVGLHRQGFRITLRCTWVRHQAAEKVSRRRRRRRVSHPAVGWDGLGRGKRDPKRRITSHLSATLGTIYCPNPASYWPTYLSGREGYFSGDGAVVVLVKPSPQGAGGVLLDGGMS